METQTMAEKMFSALADIQTTRASVASAALSNGLTLYQNGKYKEAAASFRQATALQPDYIDAYNYLAMADLKTGDRKAAIKAYSNSLQLDRTQDDIHVKLANIYIEDENYTDAEKELKTASQVNPANALPFYTLGLLQQQQGKNAEAEKSFRQTVRLSPNDGNAHYGLGLALSKQGKYNEAITQLTKATSLKKDFAPAMYELGNIYAAQGDNTKVQQQIDSLSALQTSQADGFVTDLQETLRQPKISYVVKDSSSFNFDLGTVPLVALDTTLVKPGASKEFSVTFKFDSEMDAASVNNIANWKISRGGGTTGGLYDNGFYRETDRAAATTMPVRVMYDPTKQEATVMFSIFQNDSGTGTIDTSHLTFKFQGKDVSGKSMDTTADEYNGFAGKVF